MNNKVYYTLILNSSHFFCFKNYTPLFKNEYAHIYELCFNKSLIVIYFSLSMIPIASSFQPLFIDCKTSKNEINFFGEVK